MLIGAHESVSGGVAKALLRGEADGCEAIQVFVRSSRSWKDKPLDPDDVALFRAGLSAAQQAGQGVRAVVAHGSYLVNLAAPDEEIRKRGMACFRDELERCEELGIPSLVFHPGSPLDQPKEWGLRTIAEGLDALLKATAGYSVRPVLENTAGQGNHVGSDFADLRVIVDGVGDPDRVGVCFDTQHAFAAGWDLRTHEGYDACFSALDAAVGLDRLAAFHLNDSKKDLGARVDRHENIGQGLLGEALFARLVNDPRFATLPGLAETPADKSNKSQPYAREVSLLKSLRTAG